MAPSATTESVVPTLKVAVSKEPEKHVHGGEDKTPCEAISHGMLLPGIPTFSTHAEHRRHILIHAAATFRDFSHKGFTEGMSGHISVRDPEFENYIWMNPLGRHFGLMTAGDLICLDVDTGKVVGGNRSRPANAAGFFIHSEIHKARPDVHAVCHAHTIAGRAWSAFGRGLDMLNQDVCNLYDSIAVYTEYGGIVFANEEGKNIARSLGAKKKVAILLNHGLLSTGSTVDEAGFLFGLLDRGCAIQLQVEQAMVGNPSLVKHVVSDKEAAYNFKMASEKNILYQEAQPDLEHVIEMAGPGVVERGVEMQIIDYKV
ncbi:class II aldolase/adducin N-terminal [Calycina marina]|uniref:Class II aldolase/adducin N-terminal n=1 Tax=Calycina marina TaxID=1763456 RepID=A0A9P7Z729_9HELO|nr:class II aldolase/adducin N-terminal [Calycina marina]